MNKAFTMIELTFVIVVAGILSAVMLPRLERDTTYEAALQLATHIRYTQHLAMVNDVYSLTAQNWYQSRWKIDFGNLAYSIYRDLNTNDAIDANEVAANPAKPDLLLTGDTTLSANATPELNLAQYDISDINASASCGSGTALTFDHLGRPMIDTAAGTTNTMANAYVAANMLTADCTLTLNGSNGDNAVIRIRPETGYVSIE